MHNHGLMILTSLLLFCLITLSCCLPLSCILWLLNNHLACLLSLGGLLLCVLSLGLACMPAARLSQVFDMHTPKQVKGQYATLAVDVR